MADLPSMDLGRGLRTGSSNIVVSMTYLVFNDVDEAHRIICRKIARNEGVRMSMGLH